MTEHNQTEYCKNCENEIINSFCSHCGHPRELRRIDGKYIVSEIGSVLNFNKGILYTIRELVLRPGLSIRKFIIEDRNRLVRPIIFIIICSLIYTIAQQFLHFEDGYVNYQDSEDTTTAKIFAWAQNNYGYANIIMAGFIGFWIKILFRKYNFNFFEILILLCFVMGIGMLVYTVFGVLESVTKLRILHIAGLLGFVYASWAIGQFFDKSKKMNYFKGFISYILGFLSYSIVLIILGNLIDLIIK